jgi:hypothetical protein
MDPERLYRCPECGGTDVNGTAWIHLNTNEDTGDEPPTDDYWCPDCEDHFGRVCDVATAPPFACNYHTTNETCPGRERERKLWVD